MSILFSHFFAKINQISPLESDFTEVLDTIALKPKMLYFYGKMPKNVVKEGVSGVGDMVENGVRNGAKEGTENGKRPKVVAIVGSRHNTDYGKEVAYQMAYELAKHGVVIVSGLAYGIDSVAHRGCLDAGGITVAVLGTPIDQIYPRSHTKLAAEIIEKGGAVMSEYAPGEFWQTMEGRRVSPKAAFLYRNRLIAGLADAVVVVEAALRSGSLNTAAHALEQGKEVFAVPGNITNPYSQGCNKLIAQGAFPYTGPEDVLESLDPVGFTKKALQGSEKRLIGDSDAETAILKALDKGARKGEEIMKSALLPPEVFNQTITLLEIKAKVRALGANNWTLA